MFGFEGTLRTEKFKCIESSTIMWYYFRILAWWLSWLERRPVTAEVVGSNPIRVANFSEFVYRLEQGSFANKFYEK